MPLQKTVSEGCSVLVSHVQEIEFQLGHVRYCTGMVRKMEMKCKMTLVCLISSVKTWRMGRQGGKKRKELLQIKEYVATHKLTLIICLYIKNRVEI